MSAAKFTTSDSCRTVFWEYVPLEALQQKAQQVENADFEKSSQNAHNLILRDHLERERHKHKHFLRYIYTHVHTYLWVNIYTHMMHYKRDEWLFKVPPSSFEYHSCLLTICWTNIRNVYIYIHKTLNAKAQAYLKTGHASHHSCTQSTTYMPPERRRRPALLRLSSRSHLPHIAMIQETIPNKIKKPQRLISQTIDEKKKKKWWHPLGGCGSGFGLVPGYTTLSVRVRANT